MEGRKLILDYKITHIQHPHLEKFGWVYTYVSSYVWISNLKLISELNKRFNINLEPEENITVSKELADNIWKFVDHRLGYAGMYGNEYDRNMLDIYKDYNKSGEYTL